MHQFVSLFRLNMSTHTLQCIKSDPTKATGLQPEVCKQNDFPYCPYFPFKKNFFGETMIKLNYGTRSDASLKLVMLRKHCHR